MDGSQNSNNSGQGNQGGGGSEGGASRNSTRRRRYRGNKPAGGQGGEPSVDRSEGQQTGEPRQSQAPNPNRQQNDNRPQQQGRSGQQGQGRGQQPNREGPGDHRPGDHRPGDHRPNPNRPQQNSNQGSHQSSGNRSRRPNGRVLTSNQVLVKYDNLLEQHLVTRRKYYEYFNRVDERQLYRLEKNFFDSIEHLRRFEHTLEPWQREALEERKTERYRIDSTYSDNRGWDPLTIPEVEVKPEEIEDPHFKDSQKEAFVEYQDDTEESEGSFEDYLKLKGLN